MVSASWALGGIALVAVATFAIGIWGSSTARTTSDLLVARRLVREERNAAAISGEYLSAASFLGIAGLILKDGVDALWYPIGFASGYLAVLLFVAAPLRRSGAYTIPDFVEARLDSLRLRWFSTVFVVLIGVLYLNPQFQAAGLTLATVSGVPFWAGVLAVAVLVMAGVLSGGMRAVTLVQAFQYWVKLFAITVPAFVLFGVFLTGGSHGVRLESPGPEFQHDTVVQVQTPVRLHVAEPVWVDVTGSPAPSGDGPLQPRGHAEVFVSAGDYQVDKGTQLRFPAHSPVPVVADADPDNASWLHPQDGGPDSLVETYSLILATFLGTMGLPHVLIRFYTNPSGHAARRTALFVLLLLGMFFLFPTIFGLLSRLFVPELLVTGTTDAAVLLLPNAMLSGWPGTLLTVLTAAGAFAAFVSTSSGLVVSIAGVVSTDLLRDRGVDARLVLVATALLPVALSLVLPQDDLPRGVGLAFALAASTFCPLLILGVWWRGLTAAGAGAGLTTGGVLVLAAMGASAMWPETDGIAGALLRQPALVTVPIAFSTAVLVSFATRARLPDGVSRIMLRMHAPDRLGFQDGPATRASGRGRRSVPEGRHRRR